MTTLDGIRDRQSDAEMREDVFFVPFPKIPRLRRGVVITEKIDGTNACVIVTDDGTVAAQSRTRLITPGKGTDNAGFAAWCEHNAEVLRTLLGPGRHFGEWWGQGIQRGYGLDHKRFSMFNAARWVFPEGGVQMDDGTRLEVVPVIASGPMSDATVEWALDRLRTHGSAAAPGFMDPEGIVVRHTQSGAMFKVTLANDESPKGEPPQ